MTDLDYARHLDYARQYLANEKVFRVQLSHPVGQTPKVYYCEALNEADVRMNVPVGPQIISIRRANVNDAEEMIACS